VAHTPFIGERRLGRCAAAGREHKSETLHSALSMQICNFNRTRRNRAPVFGETAVNDDKRGPPLVGLEELTRLLAAEFPQMPGADDGLVIEDIWHGGCRVRQAYRDTHLRPGGTISGPTIMALGDFAMYVAVLASIGWVPLAVTTSFNINFLRRPAQRDLLAECRLLKLGKRLAVGEVAISSDGLEATVAHITATYSIPGR
jgi:uncharacterized protein (TIGR00369 family)